MDSLIAVVSASVVSGFLGAWLGAWVQTRHDRHERLHGRRIDAADEFAVALTDAMLALSAAIALYERGEGEQVDAARVAALIDAAVTKSTRADLLFVIGSPFGDNSVRVFREMRHALAAARDGDTARATQLINAAGVTMAWLMYAASDAIRTTGTRQDSLRSLKKLKADAPDLLAANRPDITHPAEGAGGDANS